MYLTSSIFDIVYFPEQPYEVCVFFGEPQKDQLHCGIAYDDSENNKKFNILHLAMHNDLRHEDKIPTRKDKYFCVKPNINEIRLSMVAAMCRRIVKREKKLNIPYGLLYDGGTISEEQGIINVGSHAQGLTCATFVMSMFKTCGIDLIDLENWKSRPKDKIWHSKIISVLVAYQVNYSITDEHIKNVKNEIGCARFRPEEVAASSFFRNPPERTITIQSYGKLLGLALSYRIIKWLFFRI